jgi:hypothetical protein
MRNVCFEYAAFGFVDDTDIPVMNTSADETLEHVFARLQTAVSHWGQILQHTGGLLVNKKSHWWPIYFVWKGNKWDFGIRTVGASITVPTEDGLEKKIKCCRPSKGKKLMGVYAAADGNMRSQIRHCKHKLEEWFTKIEDGHLPRRAVWTAFFGTIWSTIVCALPVTTLTMKECGNIMRPIFVYLLSKVGANRNMHRDWVFAHQDFQGLRMPNVYLEQTIAQLNSIVVQTGGHTHVSDSLICMLRTTPP